jgi:uncharacterized protein YbaA (DUF1428 family)
MKYIDGFLIPIAPEKLGQYEKAATLCSQIWKELGPGIASRCAVRRCLPCFKNTEDNDAR